jgi:pyrroloquinoline quinone biosynthesis protein B
MNATVIVLGTAQDGGSPQLGSPARGPARLVSSLAVVVDDGTTLLIDVTPDVRAQIGHLESVAAYRDRKRRNAVDHIAITHAHMGHYTGLVQFGREAHNARGITAWVTPSMADFIASNQPWRALVDGGHLDLQAGFGPVTMSVGLTIRLVPVPHRAEFTDTVGVSLNDRVIYLPDIDGWERWPEAEAEISNHEICLLDATFAGLDEVPGRDLSDIPHPLVSDTIERFGHLVGDRRIILTHLNHSNPVAVSGSDEAEAVEAAGFEIATDFLTFPLAGD